MCDGRIEQIRDERILGDDLAGDPAEQSGTRPHDNRKALEQCHDDGRARHDQRDADGEAEHQKRVAAACRHGDGDDVVEAHHRVGDGDDLDGVPEVPDRLDIVVLAFLLAAQKLNGDPQKENATDQLHIGHRHQRGDEPREDDAEADGDERAERDTPGALPGWQLAACERDDDGVIARQQEVDPDDLQYGEPKTWIVHGHTAAFPLIPDTAGPHRPGRSPYPLLSKAAKARRDI